MTPIHHIQVPSAHYLSNYDDAGRWTSYWMQIECMRSLGTATPMLDVGIGHGLVSHYLRETCKEDVTTVDIDPALGPDFVADICDLPFDSNTFGVASACEVLEHLPFDHVDLALQELRRVSRHAVVSVPHVSRSIGGTVGFNFRSIRFRIELPALRRRTKPVFDDQHYWEMGLQEFDRQRIVDVMTGSGWTVKDDFRNPWNPWHRFFLLQ